MQQQQPEEEEIEQENLSPEQIQLIVNNQPLFTALTKFYNNLQQFYEYPNYKQLDLADLPIQNIKNYENDVQQGFMEFTTFLEEYQSQKSQQTNPDFDYLNEIKDYAQYFQINMINRTKMGKSTFKKKKKIYSNIQSGINKNNENLSNFQEYLQSFVKTEDLIKQNKILKEKFNPSPQQQIPQFKRQISNQNQDYQNNFQNNNQNQNNNNYQNINNTNFQNQNNNNNYQNQNNNNNQYQSRQNNFKQPLRLKGYGGGNNNRYNNNQNNDDQQENNNSANNNQQENQQSGFQSAISALGKNNNNYNRPQQKNNEDEMDNEDNNNQNRHKQYGRGRGYQNNYNNGGGYKRNQGYKNNYNRRNQDQEEQNNNGKFKLEDFDGPDKVVDLAHTSVFGTHLAGGAGGGGKKNNEDDQGNKPTYKKFNPPYKKDNNNTGNTYKPGHMANGKTVAQSKADKALQEMAEQYGLPPDDRLKVLEPKCIETIMSEVVDNKKGVTWDSIAGLTFAKKTIDEIIVQPMQNPDLFQGLRAPPKGLLLFGPPGTGKTMIAKAIAHECQSTFFSVSASSLTSKWVGEGEKLVRTLFTISRILQPSVIFLDEIDSLLTSRTEGEQEASRRIKTEFLIQLDGAGQDASDRILLIGATNRPQELDEAARRRFVKRLYIPLPNLEARFQLIQTVSRKETEKGNRYQISDNEINDIVLMTKGYSGADMTNLCSEACMNPVREIKTNIRNIKREDLRPTQHKDFIEGIKYVKKSVSETELQGYYDWNSQFGSFDISLQTQDN